MASNRVTKALKELRAAVLPLVKGYMLQEAPIRLGVYYETYLRAGTKPDRKSKSGNRYYSEPNKTNRLRTLYGNIQRALVPDPRFAGNITNVEVENEEVVLVSGIDTAARVKAGNEMTTLFYADLHEKGEGGQSKRPFLDPGIRDFNKSEMPKILDEIADELGKIYNVR